MKELVFKVFRAFIIPFVIIVILSVTLNIIFPKSLFLEGPVYRVLIGIILVGSTFYLYKKNS